MPNPLIDIKFSPKQHEAYLAIEDPDTEELLYGGAKGGGKSVFGVYWSYTTAKRLIQEYDLPARKYPLVVGFMGRKQSIDFNATTLVTWNKMIPEQAYVIREIEKVRYIVIERRAAIQIGGMDKTETINKFNSAEYAFYFIDQAEELTQDDIGLIRGTRRLIINGHTPPYKGLLTANPRICWLKSEFIDQPVKGNRFVRALPADNPFLAKGYIEQLHKAFKHRPELIKAYLQGSWEDLDTANVVISFRDVKDNVNNEQYDKTVIKRITVADISEANGVDETVIYDLENTKIVDQEIYAHRTTMDTCGRLQAHARKNKSTLICLDKVGCGIGVYDRLGEIYADDKDKDVVTIYGFDSREKANDPITFGNRRAEVWWKAGQKFAERKCDIPNDPILIKELSGVTYHFRSNGKIFIDKKEDLKAQLGKSPDRGDTYVMALEALEMAEAYSKPDAYMREEREEEEYEYTPETC